MKKDAHRHVAAWAVLWILCMACTACQSDHEIPDAEAQAIKSLLRAGLESSETRLRQDTVRVIGLTGSKELRPMLQEALKDKALPVRFSAAQWLVRGEDKSAYPVLIEALSSEDPKVRQATARAMISRETPASLRSELVTLGLRSSDADVQMRALRQSVGQTPSSKDMKILTRLVQQASPEVAAQAMLILKRRGRSDLVEKMLNQAKKGERKERLRALRILVEMGEPGAKPVFVALMDEKPGKMRDVAAQGLIVLGAESSLDTIRDQMSSAKQEEVMQILRVLQRHPSRSASSMMRLLREDHRPLVRCQVYKSLGAHPKAQARDVRRGLFDASPRVAGVALLSFLSLSADTLPQVLEELLARDEHAAYTASAMLSALEIARREGDEARHKELQRIFQTMEASLRKLLTHEVAQVRGAAAELLMARQDPWSVIEGLEHPSEELTYALLQQMLLSPEEEPLKHDDWMEEVMEDTGRLQSVRIMAGAALWKAHLADEAR